MHFCEVVARVYGRLSKPRQTSLNWFIPALVNSSVGSSPGTTGLEATIWWPFDSKNLRKVWRISAAFIRRSGALAWSAKCVMKKDFNYRDGGMPSIARGGGTLDAPAYDDRLPGASEMDTKTSPLAALNDPSLLKTD